VKSKPKISVFMVAYNQEKYIGRAIKSVIEQETIFDFELIIADDCSTDSTRQIINNYKEKYPQQIRTLFNDVNIGSQRNFSKIIEFCKGEYIAILDGDDFWTSQNKLSKQVEFLEEHAHLAISFHRVKVFYNDQSKPSYTIPIYAEPTQELSINDLFNDYFLPSSSVMFRAGLIHDLPDWFFDLPFGDKPLYMLLAQFGKIGYIDEEMSAYRIHQEGIWSLKHFDRMEYFLQKKIDLLQYFDDFTSNIYHDEIMQGISRYRISLAIEKGKRLDELDAYKLLQDEVLKQNKLLGLKNMSFNRKVVIFGTGQFALNVIKMCEILQISILFCVDNNKLRWGEEINDIPVKPPMSLLDTYSEDVIILIASMYYYEIANQLNLMGFIENDQYYNGLDVNFMLKIVQK